MKIKKRFTALLLCAFIIITSVMPVTAAEPDDSDNGDYCVFELLETRISELETQLAALWAFLASFEDSGTGLTWEEREIMERHIKQAEDLERYMFRLMYYDVCLSILNNDLLLHQRSLLERQIEVERVRLQVGFSTQRNVNALTTQLSTLNRQIILNNDTIQEKRDFINTKRGQSGYGFIDNFVITVPPVPNARNANELRTALIRNNVTLLDLTNQISNLRRHNATNLEIRTLTTQRDLLESQLRMSATSSWTAYLGIKAQYDIAVTTRLQLEADLILIENMFRLGFISDIDRRTQRYAIYEALHMEDVALIALAVAVAELDYMMIGVVGG